ncbi:MAG: type I DNA topoisomerase [Anaerolineae bacterium]|nr:type I DNA topoisomerase [Anaerolineae bacterium]
MKELKEPEFMPDPISDAYCVKCKAKRTMNNPQPVFTSNGTPATQGICPVCGTKMFKMGHTPAHEGLDPDEHTVISNAKAELANKPKMVIVESPAKARTVGRFLGKEYTVRASIGHVRDLPSNRMGVDIENDFQPHYVIPAKRKEVVRDLRAQVKNSSEVYLATDPDREGEAISWHLAQALAPAIGRRPVRRVEFHEITPSAIEHAFAHPRPIDMQRVDAQQARRILDRIVGYTLSPLLRDKLGRRGLSAGRVQSVAVRLIVEREREIEAFVPVEYWSIEAELAKQEPQRRSFIARLHRIRDQEPELHNQAEAQAIVAELEKAVYTVASVKEGQRRRSPSPPFITSTMQQEASRRLGFTAQRTMRFAQQLYEGIDLGDGPVGLITYMRTDSTNVAEQAQAEARQFIVQKYGQEFVPPEPPTYKTKAKGAQEAHEAIRPTSVLRTPESLQPYLDRNQYRLYELIWRRFVASQMVAALYDTIAVEILAGLPPIGGEKPYLFRASGSSLRFPGFLIVYEEARDEDTRDEEERKREEIPPLTVDEVLDLVRLLPAQHFTQPPPRYSEATLVRALEEYGIGRPSTYAPILSTIQQRGYVERRDGRLYPSEVGIIVNDLLVSHFPDYIDVGFTAQMEEELDRIARGEREWVPVLHDFYDTFAATLDRAERKMPVTQMNNEPTGELCPQCGHPLLYKYGRFGKFIGCSNFPQCRYSQPILVTTGARCPECGGELVEKRTRRGRTFYSCANYKGDAPDSCKFAVWSRPLPTPCPLCGGLLVEDKKEWVKCMQCGEQFAREKVAEAEVA